jgi:heme/copper-type cytochrome/quinol oxidase subunit 4
VTFYGFLVGFVAGVCVTSIVLWIIVAQRWRSSR